MRFVRIVASLSALSLGIAGTSVAAESSGQGADTTSSATAQKAYQAIAGVDRKLTRRPPTFRLARPAQTR